VKEIKRAARDEKGIRKKKVDGNETARKAYTASGSFSEPQRGIRGHDSELFHSTHSGKRVGEWYICSSGVTNGFCI
jgi:hypothetical protein